MNLLPWRRKPSQEIERAVPAELAQYGTLYSYPNSERCGEGFQQFSLVAYAGNPVVFSCLNRRMSLFTEASLKWRNTVDKHIFGDATLAKFEAPWPDGSTGDLLARMIQDVDLAGNAYIRDCGDRLERLRPDRVTIVSEIRLDERGHQVREVIGYIYDPLDDPDRDQDFYPVDEVAHWTPIPDPLFSFRGMSWLTPVIREINADVAMSDFRDGYFKNAATPNLVIKYAQQIAPEKFRAMRELIEARHAGPDNSFKTMFLDSGADLAVVGSNMTGAAFTDMQQVTGFRIAAAAGVPPLLAGIGALQENVQHGVPEALTRNFVDMTIRPLWRSAVAALQKLAPVPAKSQLWFDTSDVTALQPGEIDAATTAASNAGTLNTLIMAGFTADSAVAAVTSGDFSLLVHTGLVSVQMHPPNETPPSPVPPAQQPADEGGESNV